MVFITFCFLKMRFFVGSFLLISWNVSLLVLIIILKCRPKLWMIGMCDRNMKTFFLSNPSQYRLIFQKMEELFWNANSISNEQKDKYGKVSISLEWYRNGYVKILNTFFPYFRVKKNGWFHVSLMNTSEYCLSDKKQT